MTQKEIVAYIKHLIEEKKPGWDLKVLYAMAIYYGGTEAFANRVLSAMEGNE